MGGGGAPSAGLYMFGDMGGGGAGGGTGVGLGPDQNMRDLWSVMENLLSESVHPGAGIQVPPGAAWALESILADPGPPSHAKASSPQGVWQDTALVAALRERLAPESLPTGNVADQTLVDHLSSPTQILPSSAVGPSVHELGLRGPLQALNGAQRHPQTASMVPLGGVMPANGPLQAGGGDLWDLVPSALKAYDVAGTRAAAIESTKLSLPPTAPGIDPAHGWTSVSASVSGQATDEGSSSLGPSSQCPDSPPAVASTRRPSLGTGQSSEAPQLGRAPPSLGPPRRSTAGSSLRSRRGLPDLPVTPRDRPLAIPPAALMGGPSTPSPKPCKREVEEMHNPKEGAVKWEPGTVNKSPRAAEAQRSPGAARMAGMPPRSPTVLASPTGILAGEMARLAMGSMSPAALVDGTLPTCGSPMAPGGAASPLPGNRGQDGAGLGADGGGFSLAMGPVSGAPSPGALKRSREEDGCGSSGHGTPSVASQSPKGSGTGAPGEQMEADEVSDQEEEHEAVAGRENESRLAGNNRMKQSTKPRSVAERMRRERISVRLQRLKDVMPRTDARIDTAAMLEDAVTYIKSLQTRCKSLERHNSILAAQLEAALAGERR